MSKNDITAGDGKRHDIIPGKGALCNSVTCEVFLLLSRFGIPVAFMDRGLRNTFIAEHCSMLPFEVVIRREAAGSICKRLPALTPGTVFDPPVVEFYLKTTEKQFRGITVSSDDPLIVSQYPNSVSVTRASENDTVENRVNVEGVFREEELSYFSEMNTIIRKAMFILARAFLLQNCNLIDLKVEFGVTPEGRLVVADVIDPDSWRLVSPYGSHLDKQPYRDGAPPEEISKRYQEAADRVRLFRWIPPHAIATG
ncbi:hypothetical protein EBR66_03920 [bacterium]|nr:hypothetical protein [bacterium]